MFFTINDTKQFNLFNATSNLTDRELKMLDKSWAKYFSKDVFPTINEELFRF